jgi:hypothetical protein
MKKLTFYIAFVFIFTQSLFALSGGPDKFGYTWKDSNAPGGPVFRWIDIVTSDRKVQGLGDDNVRGPFSMSHSGPAYFRFYWLQMDKFWVGSNGFISFNNIMLASAFPTIPDSTDTRHNFISGLLADLTFSGTGNPAACYYRDTYDSLVVSYVDVPFYYQFSPYWIGANTFQIILDKTNFSITINFLSQTGTSLNGDVRTGIENLTGNIGLQPFAYSYPMANYSIRYYYPANPSYFVTDGSTKWNTQDGSGGLFLPYPTTFGLQSLIANTGNLDIIPTYTSTAKVKDQSNTIITSQGVPFSDTLFVFGDSLVTYNNAFSPPLAGTYSFVNRIAGVTGDNIHSNDSITQELVAIDTSQLYMQLKYCDNSPDAPGISWVDGTGGLGMYFVPPYYPCKVTQTQYFIESNPNGASFSAVIYDDDGPNHEPGTLLDSLLYPGTVFVGGYNDVTPVHDIVIYSGGIYVGWEMYGTDITLSQDITPPISFRSFEYVGGIWSEYRQNQSVDFMITCTIKKHHIEDIGTTIITSPVKDSITAPTPVSVWIKNFGQQAENNFKVNYKAWAHPVVSETYTGPAIPAGDSVLYTFASQVFDPLHLAGSICIWTQKLNDYDPYNDTVCRWLRIVDSVADTSHAGIIVPESQPGLGIYPNPSSGMACVKYDNPGHHPYILNVYDPYGRIAYTAGPFTGEKAYLSREFLAPGVYIVELRGENILRSKFVMSGNR